MRFRISLVHLYIEFVSFA